LALPIDLDWSCTLGTTVSPASFFIKVGEGLFLFLVERLEERRHFALFRLLGRLFQALSLLLSALPQDLLRLNHMLEALCPLPA
jgi:hypothetical protein